MRRSRLALVPLAALAFAGALLLGRRGAAIPPGPPASGPTHSRSIAVNPANPNEIWVVNQENDSVSVVNATTGQTIDVNPSPTSVSIPVGVWPRRIAFTPDGAKAYVTDSRGNVARNLHALNFTGSEIYGTISVLDPVAKVVSTTIVSGLGVEPYAVAVAPNGRWAAVTNLRSSSLSFLDTASDQVVLTFAYPANLNFPPAGTTVSQVDTDGDGQADLQTPAGIAISADSTRLYVSHFKSPFVSVLSASLDPAGNLLGVSFVKAIGLDKYAAFDLAGNPVNVSILKSQGAPRFLEDLTISPDGGRLWVPHVLHNFQHDVNDPALDPAFANRIYPAVSVVDLATETFQWSDPGQTDASARIEYELSQTQPPALPADIVPFGVGLPGAGGFTPVLSGAGSPVTGSSIQVTVSRGFGGAPVLLAIGLTETATPLLGGTLYTAPGMILSAPLLGASGVAGAGSRTWTFGVPNDPGIVGGSVYGQAAVFDANAPAGLSFSNAVRVVVGNPSDSIPPSRFGYRVGLPSRVEFSADGTRAYLLDRAGEQVLTFDATGLVPRFLSVFPRRDVAANRTPFDPARGIGDTPSGLVVLDDPSSADNDAVVYVLNETSRDLSLLRANHDAGVIAKAVATNPSVVQIDRFTPAQKQGREIFADASRPVTSANFNNSCEVCHFEGNDDSTAWRRSVGPRSTPPMFGGIFATGTLAWKPLRKNLGEFFHVAGVGENGGTAALTAAEDEALVQWAETVPVPLNPNRVNGALTPLALIGRDLYFGENATGFNPNLRSSGCVNCHPKVDPNPPNTTPFAFTIDRVLLLDSGQDAAHQPLCDVMPENLLGQAFANVNSGVNLDLNGDGVPDLDRNGDGILDLESYTPLDPDKDLSFTIPGCTTSDPSDPNFPLRTYTRGAKFFTVPTKLGVFATGPYFHDHGLRTLRAVVDPSSQSNPYTGKVRNTQHDVRGSDVQVNLQTLANGSTFDFDVDAILAFIESL
ncbi:MAG TPA: YncE family protein [Planctomycetota bacterium]|jgi:DNA-binding beta-propeller fold protein YncE|nr:YncE family protein [Planctomycetota bacterium]